VRLGRGVVDPGDARRCDRDDMDLAMKDFDARLGWYPVGDAIVIVRTVAGPSAWQEMKLAIRHKRLPARCLAD
jgi:hypothetical protein